jgi:glycosyltransferase involved in cell wall biosynthesis
MTYMANLSGVILTRNEEKNVSDCIKSLDFCSEIIIIDDFSDDNTRSIARRFGAKVYKRRMKKNFAEQRNFGLNKANGDWVLFVDADERVGEELKKEIGEELKKGGKNGYFVPRLDTVWDRKLKHGETGNLKLLRLGRKDSGKWRRRVHEAWEIKGQVGELMNPLFHYPHTTLGEFIDELNWMTTLHAEENSAEGKYSGLGKILMFPLGKFVNNYFLKLGFFDGMPGFVVSVVMSFHSFLSWSKLWLLQNRK